MMVLDLFGNNLATKHNLRNSATQSICLVGYGRILRGNMLITRSLGAPRAPTSSWGPFGPLDFVLRALRALRPCDPRSFSPEGRHHHIFTHLIRFCSLSLPA